MAAITFSGFNNIDFNSVVTAIIAQERQPITTLETQKSTLETQNTAFGTLATRLTALQTALDGLTGDTTTLASTTATSSDSASIGVTGSGGSIEGTYDVVVNAIARRQVTASASSYGSTNEVIATGGALTLTGADGSSTTIAVGALMTVKELVNAINNANEAPVTASLVQSSPGAFQIVLTGRRTGSANAFTVASTTPGVRFDSANGGAAGDVPADNVQNAADASFTVNGLAVTSASNTVTDVIPGASLTLTKQDAGKTITVSVAKDASKPKAQIQKLISAYNDMVAFMGDQRTAATNGKASIVRDPLVQHLRNSLRSTLMGQYTNDGDYDRLAQVGVGFDQSGKMVLNETVFDRALNSNTQDVQALFSGADGTAGAFGEVKKLLTDYTKAGGLVADIRKRLSTQTQDMRAKIDNFEAQLERRRLTLQKEYAAADEAMSQLNSQVNSLSALSNQYRLF